MPTTNMSHSPSPLSHCSQFSVPSFPSLQCCALEHFGRFPGSYTKPDGTCQTCNRLPGLHLPEGKSYRGDYMLCPDPMLLSPSRMLADIAAHSAALRGLMRWGSCGCLRLCVGCRSCSLWMGLLVLPLPLMTMVGVLHQGLGSSLRTDATSLLLLCVVSPLSYYLR